MRKPWCVRALALLLSMSWLAGCGGNGGSFSSDLPSSQSASIFTVATDAPLPSVISCQVTINSITLFNGTSNVSVLASPATIDFARLNGLRELLDLSTVPVGTYTSATLMLGSTASIKFVDALANPPAIQALSGTVSQTTVTVPIGNPFALAAGEIAGLAIELNLRKSLDPNGDGDVTSDVKPEFRIRLLSPDHADVTIDEFRGGVVSVTDANNFVMQGPRGRQWTVTTDNTTDFLTPEQVLSMLSPGMIVAVSGHLNRVTHAIQATELAVLSTDRFLATGLLTSVRPETGPATAVDLFVRAELPDIANLAVGEIGTLPLNGTETYRIANLRFPFTTLLFNNSALVAGQEVAIGGAMNGATLTPKRVVLLRQGQAGAWVPGSVLGGTFKLDVRQNSIASMLLPDPLTVVTTAETRFINMSGLADLTGTQPIPLRAQGFILLNASHQPVLVARAVEKLTP